MNRKSFLARITFVLGIVALIAILVDVWLIRKGTMSIASTPALTTDQPSTSLDEMQVVDFLLKREEKGGARGDIVLHLQKGALMQIWEYDGAQLYAPIESSRRQDLLAQVKESSLGGWCSKDARLRPYISIDFTELSHNQANVIVTQSLPHSRTIQWYQIRLEKVNNRLKILNESELRREIWDCPRPT